MLKSLLQGKAKAQDNPNLFVVGMVRNFKLYKITGEIVSRSFVYHCGRKVNQTFQARIVNFTLIGERGLDGADHPQYRFAEGHYPASLVFDHGYDGNRKNAMASPGFELVSRLRSSDTLSGASLIVTAVVISIWPPANSRRFALPIGLFLGNSVQSLAVRVFFCRQGLFGGRELAPGPLSNSVLGTI
jgi:hypothetical protein